MRASFYLIVSDTGATRVSPSKPDSIRSNEVSMFMNMDLPDHLFHKPLLSANIQVEADEIKPAEIKMKFDAIGEWLATKEEEDE